MIWLLWTIRNELARRRRTAQAMREMRRNNYTAEWHDYKRLERLG